MRLLAIERPFERPFKRPSRRPSHLLAHFDVLGDNRPEEMRKQITKKTITLITSQSHHGRSEALMLDVEDLVASVVMVMGDERERK